MADYTADKIRNIAFLGHGGSGKTSLAEAMLYLTKGSDRLGKVTDGNTVCDYDPEEIKRGFSLTLAIAPVEWEKVKINIIDTPGYLDFAGEAIEAVRVADASVIVVDGKAGLEGGAELGWEYSDDEGISRAIFVNKCDDPDFDFGRVFSELRDTFGTSVCPVFIPFKNGNEVVMVDLIEMQAFKYDDKGNRTAAEMTDAMKADAEKYKEAFNEAIAETSEELLEKYFGGEEITIDEIKTVIRKATIDNTMVPVTCGSSYRNKGVQMMLDAVIDYMPAPTDIPAIKGTNPETDAEEERPASDDEPFAALAFKIATDPFVGKLCFFRVYSGKVDAGTTVFNSVKGNRERLGRILQMHANDRKDIECCYSGDIAAAVGLKNTTTGDTLCDEKHPIILESMEFPEPVIRVAIEPKTKAGQEKMGIALAKLAEEDPTFKAYTDEETGQTIIAGMGELHLEIIVDRLLREFKVEANIGAPQVAYKETIRKEASVDEKYARQSGGKGQYGHVKINVFPNKDHGYEFVNSVVGGAIPKEYIPAVDQGIQGAMLSGVVAGYNVVDVKVELYDGSYHEVDSSEMAFKIAGSMAFKSAMKKADPVLLEPIMKVSVITPEEYLGDVIGDLNSRRGMIQSMEADNGVQRVTAHVPLSEMFGYATDMRSKTQGRGQYVMEPDTYAEVPKNIAEKIMSDRKKD
jgi:elongation factor G